MRTTAVHSCLLEVKSAGGAEFAPAHDGEPVAEAEESVADESPDAVAEPRVPLDHLLGPEDGAKVLAQRRLGGGRIHHAMRTIAQCKLAFDMMCERALSRESHGKIIAEHQMVQEKIADSYASIRMLRLFVLETAWKIDNTSTRETRTDISAVKYTMAKVLREVSYNALHIFGSLGTTDLTPLQAMYAAALEATTRMASSSTAIFR